MQSGQRHTNSTAHREKRATITFDTNIHTTAKPQQDSGQFYCNNCSTPLFMVMFQLWVLCLIDKIKLFIAHIIKSQKLLDCNCLLLALKDTILRPFSSPFLSVHLYVLCLPRLWCVLFSGWNGQLHVSSAFQCDSPHGPSQSSTSLLCSGKWRGSDWQSATSSAVPLRKWGWLISAHQLLIWTIHHKKKFLSSIYLTNLLVFRSLCLCPQMSRCQAVRSV